MRSIIGVAALALSLVPDVVVGHPALRDEDERPISASGAAGQSPTFVAFSTSTHWSTGYYWSTEYHWSTEYTFPAISPAIPTPTSGSDKPGNVFTSALTTTTA